MSTAGYNSKGSEVNVRYARGRRGDSLILPNGMRPLLFLFGFLSSHDIAQGIQREKVGGGHAGTTKVRLPPSYRTMPPEIRY